jgi:hypothetical protein
VVGGRSRRADSRRRRRHRSSREQQQQHGVRSDARDRSLRRGRGCSPRYPDLQPHAPRDASRRRW